MARAKPPQTAPSSPPAPEASIDANPVDADDTEPGDTGPGDTGPGDTGPGDTEPGDTGPGDAAVDGMIRVRRIHRRDLNRVWDFLKRVFRLVNRETVEYQRPRTKTRFLENYEEEGIEQLLFEIREGSSHSIVGYAECAYEVLGSDSWINERYFSNRDMRPLFVEEIAIHPGYQGLGIGSFVIEQLEHLARLRGCTHLVLEVAENNNKALSFYRARSFYQLDAAIFLAKKVSSEPDLLPPRPLRAARPASAPQPGPTDSPTRKPRKPKAPGSTDSPARKRKPSVPTDSPARQRKSPVPTDSPASKRKPVPTDSPANKRKPVPTDSPARKRKPPVPTDSPASKRKSPVLTDSPARAPRIRLARALTAPAADPPASPPPARPRKPDRE